MDNQGMDNIQGEGNYERHRKWKLKYSHIGIEDKPIDQLDQIIIDQQDKPQYSQRFGINLNNVRNSESRWNSKQFTLRPRQVLEWDSNNDGYKETFNTLQSSIENTGLIKVNVSNSNQLPFDENSNRTPSFNSVSNQLFGTNGDMDENKENMNSQQNKNFGQTVHKYVNKDLLTTMKEADIITKKMGETIIKYKDYYKMEILEDQLTKLNALLHQSFNLSLSQIVELTFKRHQVDISDKNSCDTTSDPGNKPGLKDIRQKYRKLKRSMKEKWQELNEARTTHIEERTQLLKMIQSLQLVRENKLANKHSHSESILKWDKLDSDNQSCDSDQILIKKLENEREQARFYAKELEHELQLTKNDLHENQIQLIEPLKSRLIELESLIQEKEQKVKKQYRRKLRRWRKELDNEK